MCVAPFHLFSWAAQYLPSGLSSIYNSTTPIATMLVALAILPDERLTKIETAGLFVAAGGVIVVAAPWAVTTHTTNDMFFWAQLACLGGTTCYGLGFTYARRFLRKYDCDAITISASQIGAGAAIILLLTPFIGMSPVSLTPGIVESVVVLGGIGTGIAYVWYTNVINAWGATNASTVTYLTPITGIILGTLILGETIVWNQIVGGIIIIIAILVGQGRLRPPRHKQQMMPELSASQREIAAMTLCDPKSQRLRSTGGDT